MELFEKIRREYEEGVGTVQGVARKLGVQRRMVRDAIRNAIPAQRKKIEREPTRLVREVVLFIHIVLEQDQQAPRKRCGSVNSSVELRMDVTVNVTEVAG